MVDYTTRTSGGWGMGLYIAAGLVALVLLYAIFAGGTGGTTSDPASISEPAAADTDATPVPTE